MSLFGRDVVSARNIPSNIRSSKVAKIPEYIKEFTDLVKSVDKSIADFTEYKRSWQSKLTPGLDDLRKTVYQSQIVNIDLNIDKLNNYKTKLNQIIDRWNYVMRKNINKKESVCESIKKTLFGKLRKLKKDMISDMSKPQKPVKRTKRGKRCKRTKRVKLNNFRGGGIPDGFELINVNDLVHLSNQCNKLKGGWDQWSLFNETGNCLCYKCKKYYYYVNEENPNISGWYTVGAPRGEEMVYTRNFEKNTGYYNSKTKQYLCPECTRDPIPEYDPYEEDPMKRLVNAQLRFAPFK